MKIWTRKPAGRHRAGGDERPAPPPPTATPSPETERAIRAAERAAEELRQARQVRRKIDRLGDAIDRETSKNGFRLIIESALGGKA